MRYSMGKRIERICIMFSSTRHCGMVWIRSLAERIWRFYGKEAVLLIDEYDQPVQNSFENGYREEMGDFFTVMYGAALKGNEYVSQALLTGVQRVAKESIFSKLNNLQVYSVVCRDYAEYFGMTADDTKSVLQKIVAEQAHVSDDSLRGMFRYLQDGDIEHFMSVYKEIVIF